MSCRNYCWNIKAKIFLRGQTHENKRKNNTNKRLLDLLFDLHNIENYFLLRIYSILDHKQSKYIIYTY